MVSANRERLGKLHDFQLAKSTVVEFITQVAAAVVAALIVTAILSPKLFQSVWASYPIPTIVFWIAFAFIILRTGFWVIGKAKGCWNKRGMIQKITGFLGKWDQLGILHSEGKTQDEANLKPKLIMLFTPIGPYVRQSAPISYSDPVDGTVIPDFDPISNLLADNFGFGLSYEKMWTMGRNQLLAALGMLGYKPE